MKRNKSKKNFRILLRLIPYLWPNDFRVRVRVTLALIFLVLAKVSTVATPLFMIWTVDTLSEDLNSVSSSILIEIGAIGLVVSYGLMRIFAVGFTQLRDGVFSLVGQRSLRSLALRTFSHIHDLSIRFHLDRKTGALSRVIDRGIKGVDFLLRFLLFSIVPLFLELLFVTLLLIFRFDWSYAILVFITLVIYFLFTFKVTDWRLKIRKRMNERDAEAAQKAVDSLINYETVKLFNSEKLERARYDESMKEYEVAAVQTGVSLAMLNFGQSLIISFGLIAAMIIAAYEVMNGSLSVGEFVGINAIMVQIVMPLNFLGTVYREIRQSLVDMSDMFEILDEPMEIKDKVNAKKLNIKLGSVSFSKVSFSYNKGREIIRNLSFEVRAGETLAIVGASGVGKSTIGRLLFRFYDVNEGEITVDGQNLQDISLASLREAIGVVPQDTVLFNDSIGYNISYGRSNATYEEVREAARAAQIGEFIETLPHGYNTLVGERGLKLSGGEKQRIGIARIFLKNPPILLLDEASSSLDTETEKEILKSIKMVGKDRTVITIAHRLSTVLHANKILVMENGQVIEQGSHTELLKLGSRYSAMWHKQQFEENDTV